MTQMLKLADKDCVISVINMLTYRDGQLEKMARA